VLARAKGGIYLNATIAITIEPTLDLVNQAPEFVEIIPVPIVFKIQNFTDKPENYRSPKVVDEEENAISMEYQDENIPKLGWLKFINMNNYFEL
jgi:hypothetical protein